jgi:hypothetical protein
MYFAGDGMQQGSFGNGTQANKNTPVYTVDVLGLPLTAASLISSGHSLSCAVIGSSNLQCWGDCFHGKLAMTTQAKKMVTPSVSIAMTIAFTGWAGGDGGAAVTQRL